MSAYDHNDPESAIADSVEWFATLDDADLRDRVLNSPSLREPGVARALVDGLRLLAPDHDPVLRKRYRRLAGYVAAVALLVDGWQDDAAA